MVCRVVTIVVHLSFQRSIDIVSVGERLLARTSATWTFTLFVVEVNKMKIHFCIFSVFFMHQDAWVGDRTSKLPLEWWTCKNTSMNRTTLLCSDAYAMQTHSKQNSQKNHMLPYVAHCFPIFMPHFFTKTLANRLLIGLGTFGEVA